MTKPSVCFFCKARGSLRAVKRRELCCCCWAWLRKAAPVARVWAHLLLLGFSCLDSNGRHNESWPTVPLSPRDDGLESVPNVFPDGRSFPFQFDHHQLSNVNIQRNKKSVGFILSDAFNSDGEKKKAYQTHRLGLQGTEGSLHLFVFCSSTKWSLPWASSAAPVTNFSV